MEVEGEITEIDSEGENVSDILDTIVRKLRCLVVRICVISWLLGFSAGILLIRFYFQRGAHTRLLRWLLLCIGLPIPLLPILDGQRISSIATVGYSVLIGLLGAMALGVSLFYPSSLGFLFIVSMFCSELFALFLLAHGITYCPLNSIVLLAVHAALSGLWSSGERPGVSRSHFILGFVFTISGVVLPLAQRAFQEIVAEESLVLVTVMSQSFMVMITATVGLIINGDFGDLRQEYHHLRSDPSRHWIITLVDSTVAWQTFFLGFIGLVFLASSLFYEM